MTTQSQLDKLKSAYYRGVLKIREGDTWVEYQSMKEMRIAIEDAEAELNPEGRSTNVRVVSTSRGFNK